MRAKVYGTGSTDSIIFNVQNQNNVCAAIDGGTILATTRDSLTVTSAALAPGTPVDLEVRVRFHAATGVTGGPADPTHFPGFIQGAPQARLFFNGAVMTVQPWVNPEATFDEVYIYTRAVGAALPLYFDLQVQGGMNALASLGDIGLGPYTDPEGSGFADASATVRTSIRVLTPGAGYIADSGTVYPTTLAVPEPGTALPWCAGMLGLAAATVTARARPARGRVG